MSQLEVIKQQLHDLIDRVDDEDVLTRYFNALFAEVQGKTVKVQLDNTLKESIN